MKLILLAIMFSAIATFASARELGYVNEPLHDSIVVYSASTGAFVTGLTNADFSKLVTKDGAVSAVTATVTEMDDSTRPGMYDVAFTPTSTGTWTVLVTQATHFPDGKVAVYEVSGYSIDDVWTKVNALAP